MIHSELDRPILGFSVNGMAGANAFAHGGGSTTCCGDIRGKEAEVVWTLSTTRAQYNTGLREEVRRITLPLPERKHGQDFLHVHFLPGDKVFWVGVKELVRPMRNEKNLLIRVEKSGGAAVISESVISAAVRAQQSEDGKVGNCGRIWHVAFFLMEWDEISTGMRQTAV